MLWIILGIVLIVAAFVLIVLMGLKKIDVEWGVVAVWIITVGTTLLVGELQEKQTAIEALKGNNPYEMKILFEKGDTIAYDTIYIKK